MTEFDRLRTEVVALFGDALAGLPALDDATTERMGALRERIEKGTFNVLVCGEFKRGKSTLVNALLEEPGLCPADVDIATSVVSTIGWAEQESVVVHIGQIGATEAVPISRADIPRYVKEAENPGNQREARLLEIGLPNEKLASGLTLVDSPGVGGVNVEHTAVTYLFLPNTDAVLFVGDATEPLSTKELEFLGDVAGYAAAVVCAMTKIDLVVDATAQLDAARERIADRLGRRPDEVVVVPVSSKRKLDGLKLGDPERVQESNYPALEDELWAGIGRRSGALQLSGGLLDLAETIDRARSPLAVERTALREESEPKLAELRDKIIELRERSAALGRDRSEWRGQLVEQLDRAGRKVGETLARDIDRIDARLELEYLEDEAMLSDPEGIVAKVTKDMAKAVGHAGEDFSLQAGDILTDLALQTSIDLSDLPGVEPPEFEAETDLGDLDFARATSATPANRLFRQVRGATMGFGAAKVLLGSILGVASLPLLAIGGLIGIAMGAKEQSENMKESDLRQVKLELQRKLRPVLNDNKRSARTAIDGMVRDARTQMVKALEERIKADQVAITEMISSLDETGRMTAEQAKTRQAELDARLAEVDKLGRRTHELRVAVERLGSADDGAPAVSDVDEA